MVPPLDNHAYDDRYISRGGRSNIMDGNVGTGKKKVRLSRDKDRYIFIRNRVAAFTIMGLCFPCFGFGIVALAFVPRLERYDNSGLVPILLVINLASAVMFLTFWAIVLGFIALLAFG